MNRKTDRRSLYTRERIKTACYQLLQKKPMEQISITELCKAADINRSTFYLHYQDVPDVYKNMLTEILDSIEPDASRVLADPQIDWQLSGEIYQDIMKDPKKMFLIQNGFQYDPFLKMFAEREVRWSMPYYRNHSRLSEDDLHLILTTLYYSQLVSDRYYLETHAVKELEHFNLMFNKYIITPVHEKLTEQ